MKIALYIEDGLEQIVLTPETDTEKAILAKMDDGSRALEIKHGSFYGCRGGWVRQKQSFVGMYDQARKDDESTMIVLRQKVVAEDTSDRQPNPGMNPNA